MHILCTFTLLVDGVLLLLPSSSMLDGPTSRHLNGLSPCLRSRSTPKKSDCDQDVFEVLCVGHDHDRSDAECIIAASTALAIAVELRAQ